MQKHHQGNNISSAEEAKCNEDKDKSEVKRPAAESCGEVSNSNTDCSESTEGIAPCSDRQAAHTENNGNCSGPSLQRQVSAQQQQQQQAGGGGAQESLLSASRKSSNVKRKGRFNIVVQDGVPPPAQNGGKAGGGPATKQTTAPAPAPNSPRGTNCSKYVVTAVNKGCSAEAGAVPDTEYQQAAPASAPAPVAISGDIGGAPSIAKPSARPPRSTSVSSTGPAPAAAAGAKKKGRFVLISADNNDAASTSTAGTNVTHAVAILPTKEAIVADVPPPVVAVVQPSTVVTVVHHNDDMHQPVPAQLTTNQQPKQQVRQARLKARLKPQVGMITQPHIQSAPITSTSGEPCGLKKLFYFLDQMKQEVTDADQTIRALQKEVKFLRDKNRELQLQNSNLEIKYADEKQTRKAAEAKVKVLKKKCKQIKDNTSNTQNTTAPSDDLPAYDQYVDPTPNAATKQEKPVDCAKQQPLILPPSMEIDNADKSEQQPTATNLLNIKTESGSSSSLSDDEKKNEPAAGPNMSSDTPSPNGNHAEPVGILYVTNTSGTFNISSPKSMNDVSKSFSSLPALNAHLSSTLQHHDDCASLPPPPPLAGGLRSPSPTIISPKHQPNVTFDHNQENNNFDPLNIVQQHLSKSADGDRSEENNLREASPTSLKNNPTKSITEQFDPLRSTNHPVQQQHHLPPFPHVIGIVNNTHNGINIPSGSAVVNGVPTPPQPFPQLPHLQQNMQANPLWINPNINPQLTHVMSLPPHFQHTPSQFQQVTMDPFDQITNRRTVQTLHVNQQLHHGGQDTWQ